MKNNPEPMKNKLLEAIADTIKGNWPLDALSDYKGKTLTYADLGRRIAEIHLLYKAVCVRTGDKVALCARNSA